MDKALAMLIDLKGQINALYVQGEITNSKREFLIGQATVLGNSIEFAAKEMAHVKHRYQRGDVTPEEAAMMMQ